MTPKVKKTFFTILFMVTGVLMFAQNVKVDTDEFSPIALFMGAIEWMAPIAFLGVVSLVLFFVKFGILYFKEKLDAGKFYLKLKGFIKNGQYDEAVKTCQPHKDKILGFVFWNGLLAFNDAKKAGKQGVELEESLANALNEAGMQKAPQVTAGLHWFDIVGQVATLLGLLGTIAGLIDAFSALASLGESEQGAALTGGIAKAMGTTGFGLLVAIPTMFFKGILEGRATTIVSKIDEYSVKIVNEISNSIKK